MAVALLLGVWASSRLSAQSDPLARAHELERLGRNQEAAAAFRQVLARNPSNSVALLGAERVMTALGERDSILALARRAVEADPHNVTARQVEVRASRAIGGEALAAEALRRWIEAAPRSEAPYRELIRLLIARGRLPDARAAVETARTRAGNPNALRPELAQIEIADSNWVAAAELWRAEVLERPELLAVAAFNLQNAPPRVRDRLVRVLSAPDERLAPQRLAAELLLYWGLAGRAWQVLQAALPSSREERVALVRAFADRARGQELPEALRVAGLAFEYLATIVPPSEAVRFRVEGARALSEGGDPQAARRVLRDLAEDPRTPAASMVSAATTVVELSARERNPAEAQRTLERFRTRIPGSEYHRLAIVVARAWIAQGDLTRAETAIESDSSLAADEVRGWVALYRGQLSQARELLRAAGASGGPRGGATDRATVAALLQAVATDSLPALGAALFQVARGDTAGGARAVAAVARQPGRAGAAELLAHAARLLRSADPALAEQLWTEVAERHPESSPAASALLEIARALATRGELAAAQRRLEQLILEHPGSALVPEARRELDRVRGLVPRG